MKRQARLDELDSRCFGRSLMILALAGLGTLVLTTFFIRTPHSQEQVAATVRVAHVGNDNGSGQREMKIEALLDDGRMVLAFGRPLHAPRAGERIYLRKRMHWFGYQSYYWEGLRP